MQKQFRCLTDELNAFLNDFLELEKYVEFMSEALDAAKAENTSLFGKNDELIAKNEAFERKVAQLKQYSRANNLEVRGVLVTKDDDCTGYCTCSATRTSAR